MIKCKYPLLKCNYIPYDILKGFCILTNLWSLYTNKHAPRNKLTPLYDNFQQKFSQKSPNSTSNNSPYLGKYPSSVSRTCLCCPRLFLKTIFFLPSPAVGVYSDFTLLRQIKSWVQVPLLPLLQIEPEAEPEEVKTPDGAPRDLLP